MDTSLRYTSLCLRRNPNFPLPSVHLTLIQITYDCWDHHAPNLWRLHPLAPHWYWGICRCLRYPNAPRSSPHLLSQSPSPLDSPFLLGWATPDSLSMHQVLGSFSFFLLPRVFAALSLNGPLLNIFQWSGATPPQGKPSRILLDLQYCPSQNPCSFWLYLLRVIVAFYICYLFTSISINRLYAFWRRKLQ